MFEKFLNTKVIVRTERAGVFYGILSAIVGGEAIIKSCRRLWYWDGAASLSQLAAEGVKKPQNCKFTVTLPEIGVRGVIEVLPVSVEAAEIIEKVPVWKV